MADLLAGKQTENRGLLALAHGIAGDLAMLPGWIELGKGMGVQRRHGVPPTFLFEPMGTFGILTWHGRGGAAPRWLLGPEPVTE